VTCVVEVNELILSGTPRVALRHVRATGARNLSSLMGIAGTLLLHALAVPSLILGAAAHKPHKQEPLGAGVQRTASPVAPAETLVLISLSNSVKPDADPLGGTGALGFRLEKVRAPLTPPSLPSISFDGADLPAAAPETTANAGDAAERVLMFGRYTGQISARIERAWEKPKSPVNKLSTERSWVAIDPDTFVCQVQIRQDNRGNVQEVLLLACNGTEAWRHSLVIAINQSSPLPAPPIPTVFQRTLTMTFSAQESHDERFAGTNE
jgi:TonB C terminal